ncbi:peptidoglycan-associated lipoprotein Pal [bacterium]|nr:peptidoglycan-associated lipoprotein Pal [bacterium]
MMSTSSSSPFLRIFSVLCLLLLFTLGGCSAFSGGGDDALGGINGAGGEGYLGLSEAELDADLAARYGSGSIPEAEGEGVFKDIRFGFDSYTVDDSARERLSRNVEVLKANPGVSVQLEGHCDERGTSEYNLALGQRRAEAVRDALIALGIQRNRVETISYGSEVPLDTRSNEEAWSLNRRVHFTPFTNNP